MNKLKFKKVLLFSVLLIFLISVFSISCFAADSYHFKPGDSIVFDSSLSGQGFTSVVFDFTSNGSSFSSITYNYMGYMVIKYDTTEVYNQSGWVNEEYRFLTIDSSVSFSSGVAFTNFLNNNATVSIAPGYYSAIYDILITNIYGDIPITSDMTLSVSFISTILSLLVVLAPVLVGGFIFVWCLKRF